jgi:hypothetical protein
MTTPLYQKILQIYPQLQPVDCYGEQAKFVLQNDGNGDYIKSWTHPTLTEPTSAQLQEIT